MLSFLSVDQISSSKAFNSGILKAVLLCFVILFAIPKLAPGEIVDCIVAVVNADIITLSDFQKEEQLAIEQLKSQNPNFPLDKERARIKNEVLNRMIDQKLAEQEAGRLGLTVTDVDVDSAIERILNDYGITKGQLAENLKNDGMTMDRYRINLKEQIQRIKIVQAVKSKVVITDDRLKEYYQNNKRIYSTKKRYKVQHIVFKVEASQDRRTMLNRAENVLEQLKNGADFGTCARKFSTYSTGSEGGDLGYILQDELAPYMMEIIPKLKVGEISPVMETPIGFQIFQVADISEAKEKTFDEVKEEIHRILFEQDANVRFASWIKELRNKSHVELLLDSRSLSDSGDRHEGSGMEKIRR